MEKLESIMPAAQRRLATISSDGLLIDAAKLFRDREVNLVVVCDHTGKMVGVITKIDIVKRISECAGGGCNTAASHVMTQEVTFCRASDWLEDVWSVIKKNGFKNMPVVDDMMKPVGVLNVGDALDALLQGAQHEEQILRDYVTGVGYR